MFSTRLRGALGAATLSRRPETESEDQPHNLFSEPRADADIQNESVSTDGAAVVTCWCGLGLGNVTRITIVFIWTAANYK